MNELTAYYADVLQTDDNLIGTYTDADGKTVVLVLDDTPEVLAPHALRADGVKFVKCGRISIGPPDWPDMPASPEGTHPLDYINPTDKFRPAPAGVSVGHYRITAGTLGTYVIDKVTGARVILSNNHVLANIDSGKVGDAILQPGAADGGILGVDNIGTLARFVPLRVDTTKLVDAAIAKMNSQDDVDESIISIGKVHGICEPYLGQAVWKYGRTSEKTRGMIVAVDAAIKVNYGVATLTIQDCFVSSTYGAPGDSGSLFLDFASNQAVGLLFAGGTDGVGNTISIGCTMQNIARLLNIETIPLAEYQRSLWLDISKWQGDVNFTTAKERGVRGVIMKATQGGDHIDPMFAINYDKARAAGLLVGCYIYVDPDASANAHFANFTNAVGSRQFDTPVVLDCEDAGGLSNDAITSIVQNLAATVSAWDGRRVMIYTSLGWWNEHINPWSGWKDYPLWVAYWSNVAMYPDVPTAWKVDGKIPAGVPVMWQFRVGKGLGPYFGVSSTDIDMDTTYPAFEDILDGVEPPPPPDTVRLTIVIEGEGSVIPGSGEYPKDSAVTLTATPAQGWEFDGWELDDGATDTNPLTLTLTEDIVVLARFVGGDGDQPAEFVHNKGTTTVNLNYRTGPGTNYTKLGTMATGTVVEILETRQDANKNTWARIGYNEWAAMVWYGQDYIEFVMDNA